MSELEKRKTTSARLHDEFWSRYQTRTNYIDFVKQNDRFYNGEQWPDNNVYNNIRITNNKIAKGIRSIASKLNGTPLHLAFTASDGVTDCTALKRYDDFVLSKMGHEAFSFQSAINGENQSIEFTYVRFDADCPWDSGGLYDGGLEEEHIHPLNFAVANPHQPNVQKQEWIMIWSDIYVGQLRKILKDEKFTEEEYKARLALLYGEASGDEYKKDGSNPSKDIINGSLVNCYMRFFRIKGEVCYTMETEYVSLLKYPRPLSKKVRASFAAKVQKEFDKRKEDNADFDSSDEYSDERQFRLVEDLDIDFEDTIANIVDSASSESKARKYREKFSLYPFAVFVPKQINNSFIGRSMTYEMINSQKGLNTALSYQLKALENSAWNKVYVRDGAMKSGENYSNNIEDNIQHDHYKGNGNGFYTITPPSMPADLIKVPDYLRSEMEDSHGFTKFAEGNMTNQETSGYAVSLMLKQANSTLEQEQKLFWQYQVDLARIRIMFYKHYIDERMYTYELNDVEYDDEENQRQLILEGYANGKTLNRPDNGQPIPFEAIKQRYGKPTNHTQVRVFDAKTIWGVDFDIKIVAQQGLVESELSTQQWYTQMFGNGGIQAFKDDPDTLDFIIKTAPKGCLPEEMRASMKYWTDKMKNSRIRQLEAQVQQLSQALEQAATYGKEQQAQFQSAINMARTQVANAQSERDQAARSAEALMRQGMSEGEIKSNNAKGMNAQVQSAIANQSGQAL